MPGCLALLVFFKIILHLFNKIPVLFELISIRMHICVCCLVFACPITHFIWERHVCFFFFEKLLLFSAFQFYLSSMVSVKGGIVFISILGNDYSWLSQRLPPGWV